MPHLLANIFGFDQTVGWGLQYLCNSHLEFQILYSFLSPGGDIFDLLVNLDDRGYMYEFHIVSLKVVCAYFPELFTCNIHICIVMGQSRVP